MNKIAIICISAFYTCIALVSCRDSKNTSKEHLVFRYNEHSNITSLDPAFAKDQRNMWACNQLFSGLTQLDENLQIQPDIAKSWTISADGLRYDFTLREDVYFHKHLLFGTDSTRTVTATDFKYSLERLLDPKIASPGAWTLQKVAHISVLNKHQLQIVLKKPFPAFLGLLTMKFCSVLPKEIVSFYGKNFRSNPIGTGPFIFKKWKENIKLVFRKNQLYYEKDQTGKRLPYLEAVAITFLPDKQSELLQFVQGNIDFLNSLDPSYKDELLTSKGVLTAKYKGAFNMLVGPYLNTEYLGIYLDSKTPEIQSKLLRQAINFGFDRDKMITYLRNGIGIPATSGFIPKGLPGHSNDNYYTYQPEKARILINRYKTATGQQNPTVRISTNAQYLDLCEYIQRELQAIGLHVNLEVMPPSTLRKKRSSGALDIFRSSWIADYPDAENYLSLFYSPNFAPSGPNYTHFKNIQYDALYENSLLETDTEKRLQNYQQMDSIVMDHAAIVPLYYDQAVRFTQKNVHGLGINPVNMLDLRRVSKKPIK